MRLVCPNCGAQYEVDDRVMPELGRDVQCSNCGHAWFHTPPQLSETETEDASEPKIEIPAPAPSSSRTDQEPDAAPEADADPELDTDPYDQELDETLEEDIEVSSEAENQDLTDDAPIEDDSDEDDDDGEAGDIPMPIAAAPRKEVSEEVKQILQEEAEQELRAREADQHGLETQPDLGLDAAQDDGTEELSERIQRMKDEEDFVEEEIQEKDLKSRDMLPDIEEINSTLDAPDDAGATKIDLEPAVAQAATGGNGFRRGFSLTILLAVLLVCLYVLAPQIADRVPQTQGVLEQYTAMGDSARMWLEGAMQSAIEKMRGLMDTSPEG
ncbi:zinc-ribbon domain-containing protein [Aliiroseovarius sp. S253]|uniref:zinc-ribbon domain-containing protein n=1 Tax=Aliiroseovarius sp. S253 TaxID=3415133 RepID=UPI003C7CC777